MKLIYNLGSYGGYTTAALGGKKTYAGYFFYNSKVVGNKNNNLIIENGRVDHREKLIKLLILILFREMWIRKKYWKQWFVLQKNLKYFLNMEQNKKIIL